MSGSPEKYWPGDKQSPMSGKAQNSPQQFGHPGGLVNIDTKVLEAATKETFMLTTFSGRDPLAARRVIGVLSILPGRGLASRAWYRAGRATDGAKHTAAIGLPAAPTEDGQERFGALSPDAGEARGGIEHQRFAK